MSNGNSRKGRENVVREKQERKNHLDDHESKQRITCDLNVQIRRRIETTALFCLPASSVRRPAGEIGDSILDRMVNDVGGTRGNCQENSGRFI
jgi:hypothetical protein